MIPYPRGIELRPIFEKAFEVNFANVSLEK